MTLSPALQDLFKDWFEAGLGEPYLPEKFHDDVEQSDRWCWSTGVDYTPRVGIDAYLFDPRPRQLLAGDWSERYLTNHNGHGMNSYALTTESITPRLAVIAQFSFGGAYEDDQAEVATIQRAHEALRNIDQLVNSAPVWPDGHLVILMSDLRLINETAFVWRDGSGMRIDYEADYPHRAEVEALLDGLGIRSGERYIPWLI